MTTQTNFNIIIRSLKDMKDELLASIRKFVHYLICFHLWVHFPN